jgi:hypothetical protein
MAETDVSVSLVGSSTVSAALASASAPLTEPHPEDEFVVLLTKSFYTNLEGALSLLLKSKRTPFSTLKASLLLSIESIRTIGGPDSVTALEQVMADFERDAKAWQAVRHTDIIPRAEVEF